MSKLILAYISVIVILGISCKKNPIDKSELSKDALFTTLSHLDSIAMYEQASFGAHADTFIVTLNDTLFGPFMVVPKSESWISIDENRILLTPYHFWSLDIDECRVRFPHLVFYDAENAKKMTDRFYGYDNDSLKEPHHVHIKIDGVYFANDDFVYVPYDWIYPRLFYGAMRGCSEFKIEDNIIRRIEIE